MTPSVKKIFSRAARAPEAFVFFLFFAYKAFCSPILAGWGARARSAQCKFYPSCSEYSWLALRQYGLIKGTMVSAFRIIKCHPWSMGGYDPVVENKKYERRTAKPSDTERQSRE